jgi:hypothetical protein
MQNIIEGMDKTKENKLASQTLAGKLYMIDGARYSKRQVFMTEKL